MAARSALASASVRPNGLTTEPALSSLPVATSRAWTAPSPLVNSITTRHRIAFSPACLPLAKPYHPQVLDGFAQLSAKLQPPRSPAPWWRGRWPATSKTDAGHGCDDDGRGSVTIISTRAGASGTSAPTMALRIPVCGPAAITSRSQPKCPRTVVTSVALPLDRICRRGPRAPKHRPGWCAAGSRGRRTRGRGRRPRCRRRRDAY